MEFGLIQCFCKEDIKFSKLRSLPVFCQKCGAKYIDVLEFGIKKGICFVNEILISPNASIAANHYFEQINSKHCYAVVKYSTEMNKYYEEDILIEEFDKELDSVEIYNFLDRIRNNMEFL